MAATRKVILKQTGKTVGNLSEAQINAIQNNPMTAGLYKIEEASEEPEEVKSLRNSKKNNKPEGEPPTE